MSITRRSRLEAARENARAGWYRYLYKPYYLRSPKRLVNRFTGDMTVSETGLPWKLPISFQPGSIIGTQLVRTGVHDLVLSEALFRVTEPGDVCLDVGANIGYTTSLLATRSGPGGRVISYEPAPDTFALLSKNVQSWRGAPIADIQIRQMAVSSEESQLMLTTPVAHRGDPGGRTLEEVSDRLAAIPVQCSTLDGAGVDNIGVLKIDVEGHELAVLQGCQRLLERRDIRDVVFEEHRSPPTAVTRRLSEAGYTVFRIEQKLGGPRLVERIEDEFPIYWDAPNYLATVEPGRALERFRPLGWRCLR
ncbi:MAG: FkbM family methyltransferase [Actinomycetota bacterium]|nr:FkbM family methyltransferase [Actinomycetota bacterium]